MRLLVLSVFLSWVCPLQADPPVEASRKVWPFIEVGKTTVPKVDRASDQKLVRNDIDAFVLSKLDSIGGSLAPEASKQVLVRRLYHDLIGLPPKASDVKAFVSDENPKAYEKLVDRLLDDPRYGERWARFWLDLARYADTAGYEGDPDLPHAWRYRDYVIDAFNQDKRYDQFIKEQIAGDEFNEIMGAGDLPGTSPERTVAMTFLRLAPFTEPRGDETRHEFLSEITGTVSSVFLGLTVGCAQCHDHKYDNIPTKDFYRMKAFFSTLTMERPEPGDIYQIGGPLPASFYRSGEKEWASSKRAQFEAEIRSSKGDLAKLTARLQREFGADSGFGIQSSSEGGNHYQFTKRNVADGKLHHSVVQSDGNSWSFANDGHRGERYEGLAGGNIGHWFRQIKDASYVQLGSWANGNGKVESTSGVSHHGHFAEVMIYDHPLSAEEHASIDKYVAARYRGKGDTALPKQGLRFWLDAADLDADPATPNPGAGSAVSSWKDKVAGIRLEQTNEDRKPKLDKLGESAALLFHDDFLIGDSKQAAFLKDGAGSIVLVYSATHGHEGYGFEVGGSGAFLSTVINPSAGGKNSIGNLVNDPNSGVSTKDRRRYRFLQNAERFIRQRLKRLKPVAMSVRHSYGPPFEAGVPTTHVLIRGEYDNKGEPVKAGFPSCVTGHQDPAKIRLDPFKRWPTRSRRMALASWIASSKNPLTARVMVNRIWAWHFGRGLVATPSDFGKLSGGATHPELLDWLAGHFVANRWSIKAMHRVMVNSATYRQSSSRDDPRLAEKDPGNKYLWRFRRRRLEAEAVRDSILAVSGRLNEERFGLPIFPPLPGDIEEAVKYSESKWDTQDGPEGRKRSIYIYQQRTLSMPMMQAFDSVVCDTSRPRRRTSVTALQALALYNGELVNEEARHFAARVRSEAGAEPDAQITHAFQIALSRPPTTEELSALKPLLVAEGSGEDGLVGLCRVLYNTNEFVYVD